MSPFHKKCLKVLNIFKDKCSDSVLGQDSTKSLYNLLLDSDDHVIKIVERNVDIDYSVLFKDVSDKFIDKFSRDVMHRGIHEILPVNILMFKYNISKTYKCAYCNEVETLRDLFFSCTFNSQLLLLIKNWIFALPNDIINILPLVEGVTVYYHKTKKISLETKSRVIVFLSVIIYRNTLNQRQYVLYYTECPSEGGIAEVGIMEGDITESGIVGCGISLQYHPLLCWAGLRKVREKYYI